MKHTPGPWRLSNTISAYECKRRKIVASEDSPESGTGICEVYGIEDECNVANARLIAAAPEMLDVLKLARVMLDAMIAASKGNIHDHCISTAGRIDEVIRKVTGTDAAQTSARGE